MDPLRLLIVADDPLVRAGLLALLEDTPGCSVVGQASSAALSADPDAAFGTELPDVIIWDAGWDTADELPEWTAEIASPIVALLADDMQSSEIWNLGVRALLRRDSDAEMLLEAARAARSGLIVIDPVLANPLMPSRNLPDASLFEELTPRESQVLQLLAEGLTNKAIAQQLQISDHTVKFHVNAILGKLRAQSRTEAVVQATRFGLISL